MSPAQKKNHVAATQAETLLHRLCRGGQLVHLATPDWAAASTSDRPPEDTTKEAESEEKAGKEKAKSRKRWEAR